MIRRWAAILTVGLVFLLPGPPLGLGAAPALPSGGGPEIAGVRVGVAGRYKPGCWTPVRVALRGVKILNGGAVVLTVPDGDGVPSQFSTPLPSPAPDVETDRTSVVLYARFGRVKSELAVELRTAEGVVDRRVFEPGASAEYLPAILSEQELVITVGPGPLGVEEAVRMLDQEPDRRTVVARVDQFEELPARWYGYEAVDVVVLSTSEPGIYAGLKPSDAHVVALDDWVRLGGRLVLCGGEHAGEVLGGEPESALGSFAPGRLKEMVTLRGVKDYELYAGSSIRMPEAKGGIRVPHLVDVDGRIEAADGHLPLVVRGARGFGQVTFVAAALDRAPFAEWEDRALLTGKLLDYPATPGDEDEEGTALMHYGYTDLAGQLRSALDQFPSVWLVPFWLVVGLVVLYVLAIGPGDYFLLRKVGRMQLTWITFPLIVVAFSATAYLLAHRLKGDRVRVNQVDLVDVDVESGRVRGTAWANVFSPRMNRYDLAFAPRLLGGRLQGEATALCAWLGLPGDALGGMNPRTAEPAVWQTCYGFSGALDALDDVPIPIWSTKSLTGRWTGRADVPIEGRLAAEQGSLEGTIRNRLPFALSDCLLAYGIHAYELGTVGPGETAEVGPSLRRRELKSLLTGRQIVIVKKEDKKDDYRSQSTPYDPSSVDAAYVLRAMMFHEAAGGRAYTGMSNRYQGFVDLSHLLKTGRAVLVGRAEPAAGDAEHHGAELLCNGRPVPREQVRHTAAYRFVFAVEGGEQGVRCGVWRVGSGE